MNHMLFMQSYKPQKHGKHIRDGIPKKLLHRRKLTSYTGLPRPAFISQPPGYDPGYNCNVEHLYCVTIQQEIGPYAIAQGHVLL